MLYDPVKAVRTEAARRMAEQMVAKHPLNATWHHLLEFINKRLQTKTGP